MRWAVAALVGLFVAAASVAPATEPPTADDVVAAYVEARGGAEAWRALRALEIKGTYAAFSKRSAFTLLRARGDRYRLDFELLDSPAIRARDETGPWGLHVLLKPEAGRIADDPYKSLLERESRFPLLLLDHDTKDVTVELLGPGEIDGTATVDLRVTLPGGQQETWHLDPETWLEVAVDSQVYDLTQGSGPIAQRLYFDDFRRVGELVLPFWLEWEFGARLESMVIAEVSVDPALDESRFHPPANGPDGP